MYSLHWLQRPPLIERCCCWNSVRKGSFAAGIFTLAFYTVVFTTCAFHVNNISDEPWVFAFSLAMLLLSGSCVITSILLIVALCGDNKEMMIPWMISVTLTTTVDMILCIILVMEASEFDFRLIFFVITDFSIVAINIYSILCVFSQFQEYSSGRGLPGGDLERRYSRSWTHPDPQVELTTAFVISSIADPPTTEEVMTKSPNGRCHSAFKGTFSPTKSTSINSSTFIPREDDDDDDVDVEQQLEEVNCVSSFDHLTESSCLQNERRGP